ncbi:DsbA family protein [Alteribacillus sp. HJP-4]|uniref:DsbA family protein n=1 Tax=Alteribacillus sp. HJP-4 TaxID=2775394 RepID=UPI0035CCDC77
MMKEKQSPLKLVVGITLGITVLLVALVIVGNMDSESNESTVENHVPIDGQPVLGESEAPVKVVEFGDYKCPACKEWGESIFPQLTDEYVDTEKVAFSYVNVLFHGEESELAALAAESVYQQDPDGYWEFHKALFDEQPSGDHDSEWVTEEKILEVAEDVPNVDTDKLASDIENGAAMNEVNKDTELVNEFDIQLTPTIIVNDTVIEDPFDYEAIQTTIEEELEGNE